MTFTTLFFDLDDTLYSSSNGLWEAIRARMSLYMHERVGLPEDIIPELRRSYYETYGTTLRGLQKHYQVDANDYLDFVHDLPLERYLQPDSRLRELLLSMSQTRWIFTNADADHAQRVIDTLELEGCFNGIIDVRRIEFACKPELVAYQRALTIAGDPIPEGCVLLDDSASNLSPARQMGFVTILVGQNGDTHPAAVHSIPDLLALPDAMPELWARNESTKTQMSEADG